MNRRIGIMGGMFDPVHRGHLQVAATARMALELDHVRLVPCAVPNHRGQATATAEQRLAMLELALADFGEPRLQTDDREFHRPGVSYMVDTLASFATQFPDATLVYIMGWDSFNTLPTWHKWRQLLDYCHLCAVSRPDVKLAAGSMATDDADWLLSRQARDVSSLFEQGHGCLYLLDELAEPAASTDIRQALAAGEQTITDIPGVVMDYIRQHQLYTTPIVNT
ncbi:MAG: nicotinate-nucleotide adenylyltransferase [Pseudohongiella sp.]|uniref:nicotinate-nucleotide adenylyltransferase n=1 Tax=Pseudohongiella sp. TaxID=1979412 RepID=UPI00349FF936